MSTQAKVEKHNDEVMDEFKLTIHKAVYSAIADMKKTDAPVAAEIHIALVQTATELMLANLVADAGLKPRHNSETVEQKMAGAILNQTTKIAAHSLNRLMDIHIDAEVVDGEDADTVRAATATGTRH